MSRTNVDQHYYSNVRPRDEVIDDRDELNLVLVPIGYR